MRSIVRRLTPAAAAVIVLAGCTSGGSDSPSSSTVGSASATSSTTSPSTASPASSSDAHMHHKMDGGPAPAGMTPATNARFPVGTTVVLQADHMPDMQGAPATVGGVYSTVTYAVTYTPTTGGPAVVNHKWVVQEELSGVGSTRVPDGGSVTITADHMPGMRGAKGTVVSSTTQPVYIVDYTAGGMTMKNHKWVVESEVEPAR